jgi:hypothetical protein
LSFRSIFAVFGPFRGFSGPDFPVIDTFPTLNDGILARRRGGCVSAQSKKVLKPRNWAPKVAVFYFVYLGIKHKPRFT